MKNARTRGTIDADSSVPARTTRATIPISVPLDSGDAGRFAFGYLVFDWDPRAPDRVPGFDARPPSGRK
jgi:hypothetical protein